MYYLFKYIKEFIKKEVESGYKIKINLNFKLKHSIPVPKCLTKGKRPYKM